MTRKIVVFYAWQSDRPAKANRSFIQRALEDAVKHSNADPTLGVEIIVDHDTQGLGGTPPVSQAILTKIAHCDIFLPDLTYVAKYDEGDKAGKPCPNPNVTVEYGHALSARGYGAMMPVMNVAYGGPEHLPFDMAHLRHPIQYTVGPAATNEERQDERKRLTAKLEDALRATIRTLPPPPVLIASEVVAKAKAWRAEAIRKINGSPSTQLLSGPELVMHLVPASAFADGRRADLSALQHQYGNLAPAGFARRRSDYDTSSRPHADGCFVYDTLSVRRAEGPRASVIERGSAWFAHVHNNGIIEIVAVIDPLGHPEDAGPKEFSGGEVEYEIVGTLDRAAVTFAAIGMTGPVMVMVSLVGVEHHRLIRSHAGHTRGFDRPFVELPELQLDKLQPPLGRSLRQLLNDLWQAAGWRDGSPSYATGDWNGYK